MLFYITWDFFSIHNIYSHYHIQNTFQPFSNSPDLNRWLFKLKDKMWTSFWPSFIIQGQASDICLASTMWQPLLAVPVEWSVVPMGGTWTWLCGTVVSLWRVDMENARWYQRNIEYLENRGRRGHLRRAMEMGVCWWRKVKAGV